MVKNEFFTAVQAAKELGISKQTLFRYEKKRVFPAPRRNLINRWRQYSYEDINKLKEIMRGNIG
jgi:DNA-binding transcriptional MerR regulator